MLLPGVPHGKPLSKVQGCATHENSTDSTRNNMCRTFVVLPRKCGRVFVASVAERMVIVSASACVGVGEVVAVSTSKY